MCRQPKLKAGKVFNCVARPASIFLATALFASARGALFASTWKYLNLWVHSMRGGALVVTGVNRGSPRRNLWQYLIYWLNQPNFSPPGGSGGDDVDHNGNDWNRFVKKSVSVMLSEVTPHIIGDAAKTTERRHKRELLDGEWVSGSWAPFTQRCSDKCTFSSLTIQSWILCPNCNMTFLPLMMLASVWTNCALEAMWDKIDADCQAFTSEE